MAEKLLVSIVEGAQLLDVSERMFHKMRHEPGFPAAVALSERCKRYKVSDLKEYVARLPQAKPENEPRQLAMSRTAREVSSGGRRGE